MIATLATATDNLLYRISPVGIVFVGDLDREAWSDLGARLGNAGRSIGFLIGDWLNYGNGKGDWGDTYTDAMRITGLQESASWGARGICSWILLA